MGGSPERGIAMLESLRELKSVSSHLNKASDSLTSTLTQINDNLNKLNLGLTVWLDGPPLSSRLIEPSARYRKQHVYSVEEREILGYAKLKNGWGLAVKEVTSIHGYFEGDDNCPFTNDMEGQARPLLDCSRDLRTRSVELLPELFKLLKEKAEHLIENLDKAQSFVSEL